MKKSSRKKSKILLVFLFIVIFIIIGIDIAVFYIYFSVSLDENKITSTKAAVCLYDKTGEEMETNLYRYIPYGDISPNIVNAFVALEDKRFFSHHGVDYYRTAGALWHNLKAGSFKEGGSTITQQLAKNTQLSSEKTLKRKIQEMRLARQIEKKYTKEEIMERYLNAIYYGNGIYGVDSACRNYFGKNPSEISLSESAVLAGAVKNPSRYSPLSHPEKAEERMKFVLSLLLEQNYIEPSEYRQALSYRYSPPPQNNLPSSPYVATALHEAARLLGVSERQVIASPYRIETYCDAAYQQSLSSGFLSGSFIHTVKNGTQAPYSALIADNKTAGVSAFYSDCDENIFSMRRNPGSVIKPILVYANAFEQGYSPASPTDDRPIDIAGYRPKNFGDSYLGSCALRDAVARSSNAVAVSLLHDLGIKNSIRVAESMGLCFSPEDNHLAVALGATAKGCTLPELTQAYMTVANGGKTAPVAFVRAIYGKQGQTVYRHRPSFRQVIGDDTAYLLKDVLRNTVKNGTARKLSALPYDVAAKTGTAENGFGSNSDAWNIAFTEENTVTVWYGDLNNTENTALSVTGGGLPTLLSEYCFRILPSPHNKKFSVPDSVFEAEIDTYARKTDGKLMFSTAYTPSSLREKNYFSVRFSPQEFSPYFDLSRTDYRVVDLGDRLQIEITSSSPCDYRLYERNLLSGSVTEYNINGSQTIEKQRRNGIYGYSLAVYYENEFLGFLKNGYYFT